MHPKPPENVPSSADSAPSHSQKRKRRVVYGGAAVSRIAHLNHTASRWALLPVLLVVWLAPFLGGSVQTWALATLFLLLALLFLIYPIVHAYPTKFIVFLVGLSILPLLAFLPVSLTGLPAWRVELTTQFAIPFPGTISPQPWLTFDAWLAWMGGVAWIFWLAGQGWTRELRKPLAELFAIGMIVLTTIGLIGFHTRHPLPFWHAERLFGPFPNRNQTANLLSLTFVLLVALLHMAVLKRSKLSIIWSAGLLILGYGLILNFSKSGIILPVLGSAFYWLMTTLTTPSRQKIWIGVASVVLAVALFLAFGGKTLDRFTSGADESDPLTSDYRLLIFQDAGNMIAHHPIFGVGLGNFASVFPLFRNLAIGTSGMIHPESDWLWLASEVGLPGAICILLAALWLLYRSYVGAFRRPHPLRLASSICGTLFILHGFFDVSGHRFGTLFPALFLFSLAWPGQATAAVISPWISRGIAFGLAAIGVAWFCNLENPPLWPGFAPLATIEKNNAQLLVVGQGGEALRQSDAALRWAPLDWQLYYQRGTSRIIQRRDWADSLLDYQRTNRIERFSPIPPDAEGIAWLSYRPELAALPWELALDRIPREERDQKYARYLEIAAPYPLLRAQLDTLGGANIAQSIIQLQNTDAAGFNARLTGFLKRHPNPDRFPAKQQRALLDIWAGNGRPQGVIAIVQTLPGLLPAGAIPYAQAYAKANKPQKACEILFQYLTPPIFPKMLRTESEATLSRDFNLHNNLAAGFALYEIQIQAPDKTAALLTLQQLERLPDAPPYLHYFSAKIFAEQENWPLAWEALSDYIRLNKL